MKGVIIEKFGDASVMQLKTDLIIPKLEKKNDVLIKVNASSINPIDYKERDGLTKIILPRKFPFKLGRDLSGIVEEVGESVTRFKKGDEVYSRIPDIRMGAFSEFVLCEEQFIALKPSNLSHVESASIPLIGLTVLQAFAHCKLKKGDKVLITGGAGGIGTFAIQYATNVLGLYVITTASEKKIDLCKQLGAKEVINYKTQDFTKELKDIDFGFDTTEETEKIFSVMKPKSTVVSIAGIPCGDVVDLKVKEGFEIATGVATLLNVAQAKIALKAWWYGVEYHYVFMSSDGKGLEQIAKFVEDGSIKPVVDKVFDLDHVADAFKYAETGRATGKVCIELSK